MVLVGQYWTATTKPSRSDDVLDADQQLKFAQQIRAQFDSVAPKRPSKPNRSEPDLSSPTAPVVDETLTIPELHKFQSLQSQSQVLISEEGAKRVEDEFVETQYYTQLGSIDKQHHTTGSGFIKVGREESEEYEYGTVDLQGGDLGAVGTVPAVLRSNPATNDWVPKMDYEDDQIYISSKPNRSESS
ncbi:maternal effect embryo arrest [Trema orientale]|uniref:Maternal effect embryo arrest n=1 Tax=Trema orientale TaxID=63057 RepID=A0A2P5BC31_TREOI|nr:maternal effect embryo arrest [Trema orientale]